MGQEKSPTERRIPVVAATHIFGNNISKGFSGNHSRFSLKGFISMRSATTHDRV